MMLFLCRPALFFLPSFALAIACGGDDGGVSLEGDENFGGVVLDDDGPVAGATVSMFGATPPVTTTTNASGEFAFEASGIDPTIHVEAPGHWGSLEQLRWDGMPRDDFEFDLPSDAVVDELGSSLGRTVLTTNGILVVEFARGDYLGAESASIDVSSDTPFTFDANDDPVESDTILSGAEEGELIYTNVAVGDTNIVVTSDGQTACSLDFDPEFDGVTVSILAKVITRAVASCGAL